MYFVRRLNISYRIPLHITDSTMYNAILMQTRYRVCKFHKFAVIVIIIIVIIIVVIDCFFIFLNSEQGQV